MSLALVPAVAHADGDPASDVLVTQTAYVPTDAGATSGELSRLGATVAAASRAGYPVRVAVIASAADLGSVTSLWRQPQNYAQFLGQELSLVSTARVLVVMPDGLGLYHPGPAIPAEQAALARPAAGRPDLAGYAITAIGNLAAAAGHPLPPLSVPAAAGGGPGAGSGDPTAWIVFGSGLALIVLAWTASLRARPVRLRSRGVEPS